MPLPKTILAAAGSSLLLAALSIAALPRHADAAEEEGYVCSAAFVPADTRGLAPGVNKGGLGYVTFDVYSQPHCEGHFVSTGYFCSAGATDTTHCYPFSELNSAAALTQKEATLIYQANQGSRVSVARQQRNGPVAFVRSYGSH